MIVSDVLNSSSLTFRCKYHLTPLLLQLYLFVMIKKALCFYGLVLPLCFSSGYSWASDECLLIYKSPCQGVKGRCTLNSERDGRPRAGGFVADTATVEQVLVPVRNGFRFWGSAQVVSENLPYIDVGAQVCGQAQVKGNAKVYGILRGDAQVLDFGYVGVNATLGYGGVIKDHGLLDFAVNLQNTVLDGSNEIRTQVDYQRFAFPNAQPPLPLLPSLQPGRKTPHDILAAQISQLTTEDDAMPYLISAIDDGYRDIAQSLLGQRDFPGLSAEFFDKISGWAQYEQMVKIIAASNNPDLSWKRALEQSFLKDNHALVERILELQPIENLEPFTDEHTLLTWFSSRKLNLDQIKKYIGRILMSADINARNSNGDTALVSAIKENHLLIVAALVQKGARIFSEDSILSIVQKSLPNTQDQVELGGFTIPSFLNLARTLLDQTTLESVYAKKSELTLLKMRTERSPEFDFLLSVLESLNIQMFRVLEIQKVLTKAYRDDPKSKVTLTCLRCLEDVTLSREEGVKTGPANCDCYLCSVCAVDFAKACKDEIGTGHDLKCPVCHDPVGPGYFKRVGVLPLERAHLQSLQVRNLKAAKPNFVQCPNPACTTGGKITETPEDTQFWCMECDWTGCLSCKTNHQKGMPCERSEQIVIEERQHREKEQRLIELGKLAAPVPSITDPEDKLYDVGRMRPCYHCGIMTERIDGCNHMTCNQCKKEWDWNLGVPGVHDGARPEIWVNSKMKYVPQSKEWFNRGE